MKFIWVLLPLIAFLLYVNTLGNGFVLDDTHLITENYLVKQGVAAIPQLLTTDYRSGTWTAKGTLYRPLSLILFAVEWQLFPNNPFPGHLVNVLIYALTAGLLFTLMWRLMPKESLMVPFFITLLFVCHPIHTEVVANIKSADELISFLFALLALHLAIGNAGAMQLVAAGTIYFLSLMSKESSITILAIVPVINYFFTNKRAKGVAVTTAAFAAGAFAYLVLRRIVLGEISGIPDVPAIDNFLVLAKDIGSKTATVGEVMGKYLQLLFFPHPLSADYGYNAIPIVTWSDYRPLISAAAYAALIVFVVIRFRRKELLVFGVAFFLITISLYSNVLITIGSGFGERFLYAPSLGFCIAIVALLARFRRSQVVAVVVIALCILGSLKTITRNTSWKSEYDLYAADVTHEPDNARLHFWYGDELMRSKGNLDLAIVEFNKAIEIYPDFPDAFAERGLAYSTKGDKPRAESDLKRAIDLKSGYWEVFNNLGVVYAEQNNFDEAVKYFELAIQRDNRFPEPYKNIGNVRFLQGNCDSAIEKYLEALKYSTITDSQLKVEVYTHLALCYSRKGDVANQQKYASLAEQGAK